MRLASFSSIFLLLPASYAVLDGHDEGADNAQLQNEAASLISIYVPSAVYSQLTASVASAASAASVTGDPASLFLSAVLATPPPAWFTSAVPTYYSSNIIALESALSTLRDAGFITTDTKTATATATSTGETLVTAQTTNSHGSTITTSYTSTLHSSSTSAGRAAAAPTMGTQQQAGMGIAALALGLAAIL
ncbi:hypothetical protein SEPCBS119000_002642 [Sporothrix epigloea]|uniref:GPI anchored protein n=1 Tax=Sporothrix epigloea TaxID=1892477 RepID=A0ABP0DIZ7_9PEZI